MNVKLTRRRVLLGGLQLPFAGGALLALSACDSGGDGDSALVCADPETMTTAEQSVRRSLNYTEVSPDPGRTCTGCDFFKPPTTGSGCGSCEIFGGGAANPAGRCDSWSADS